MCPDGDKAAFEDIAKHKFFNSNNLWCAFVSGTVPYLSLFLKQVKVCCGSVMSCGVPLLLMPPWPFWV